VPHGTLGSVTHMSFLDGSILNCMVQCTVYNIFIPVFKTNDTYYVNLYRYVGYICHWVDSVLASSNFASYQSEGDIC